MEASIAQVRLNLVGSTVGNNTAQQDGGGIYANGDVTLSSSTLYSNDAQDQGGGLALAGEGNELLVQSSTISGNSAVDDGGELHIFDFNPFRLQLLHSTLVNNYAGSSGGGAYLVAGALVTDHSIIANNTISDPLATSVAPNIDNINFFDNPTVLANYSLIGNNAGSNISELEGNLIGTVGSPIDPQLEELAEINGVLLHKLINGSPALDAGDDNIPLPPEFDQRGLGFNRIVNDVIDLGAMEVDGFTVSYVVDTLVDESDGNFGAGDFSLREAIELSNDLIGPDRIVFDPGLSGGTIELNANLGELEITDSIEIDAGGLQFGITLDADPTDDGPLLSGHRIFNINDSSSESLIDVSLIGLTLQGGDVIGTGGAIASFENLTLDSVTIMNNSASSDGGGVYHIHGALMIDNSTFSNNFALNTGDGGGIME